MTALVGRERWTLFGAALLLFVAGIVVGVLADGAAAEALELLGR